MRPKQLAETVAVNSRAARLVRTQAKRILEHVNLCVVRISGYFELTNVSSITCSLQTMCTALEHCSHSEKGNILTYLKYVLAAEGEAIRPILWAKQPIRKLLGTTALERKKASEFQILTAGPSLLGN